MFQNLSMQARLITAFMFMGVLVLIVALFGLSSSSQLSQHIDTLANNSLPSISGLWKIREGQTQIQSSEQSLLNIDLSKAERAANVAHMDLAFSQIENGFTQYNSADISDLEEKIYQEFLQKWKVWEQAHLEFLRLNLQYQTLAEHHLNGEDSGAALAAFRQLQERGEANHQPFLEAATALVKVLKVNEDLADETERVSTKDVIHVKFWAFIAILLGPGTAIMFAIFFSNTIAKPLGKKIAGVVDIAQKISAGDLTSQIVPADQRDEIGQLQNAFYRMNKDLNSLVHRIQQSGRQISEATSQITASGRDLEATMAEQLASTNQVTTTAYQIAATSKELVKTMEQVAGMADQTEIATARSQGELNRMETVMRQLFEATQLISAKLQVMNDKATNISRVITTITIVADQTNLLSLNAALEAEKAGVYGTGFAVVAREIRRLADQTAVATLEIEKMIKEMQWAVSTGVVEMGNFTTSVVNSVADVGRISDQIAEAIQQVQGLTPQFEEVSQSVEEQSLGAQQISESMEQLSQVSQQTVDSLQATNRALEQLDDAANGLRTEISRFKVLTSRND
ncbi:chemotaxis protein [Neosynechococcus sphagnicola sy1]|uniref:Chemotaxis protein n=1 Tax=Neosynechococcus sphagnicola sy1 TaxID=1497020 RepID=A0A098TMQ2_9CYAN|nr:methyl-accepting chemotaxis protein [Neosynechococcus sphagnicola]KGF73595.1 chemotaxis protein [Neosynechococcus sphagnicola sy1]